jgi:dTDP-glucose 4,6-dehydratase
MSYYTTFKTPVVLTRSSNNFGPYQYPEKLISLFATNALEDKFLPLYADGTNVRDWIYVLDNCEALDLILHKGEAGEIYNVGGGNEKTNNEITDLILDILKKPKTLIKKVEDRPGHDKRYALDCSKLKSLGWKPGHSFRDSVARTINWYKNNPAWWKPIKERLGK